MTKERLIELTNKIQDDIEDVTRKIKLEMDEKIRWNEYASQKYKETIEECMKSEYSPQESEEIARGVYDSILDRYDIDNNLEIYSKRLAYLNEQLEIYTLAMKCIRHPNF